MVQQGKHILMESLSIIDYRFLEFILPNEKENEVLAELNPLYFEISEMTEHERQFLNSLILRNKPKKLLELGVSRGGSSIIMLNAIKNIDNAQLYSIDKLEKYYTNGTTDIGAFVDNYSYLKDKWKLYTGKLALDFMDEIGSDIDFCLIDTVHKNPGEILDFLMVLPFLKEDAIVVFHDANLHTYKFGGNSREWSITNNLLMSSIHGHKFVQGNFQNNNTAFPNIAAIKLNKESRKRIWEIFNLLTLKWTYLPEQTELMSLFNYPKRFYDPYYIEYFVDVIKFHYGV